MTYGSVCSGIEAATVAWKPLGWRCAWTSEIEAFPSAVLQHHYPQTTHYGDFTKIKDPEPIDLLVGGTPCQAFSVAGLRGGLDDARGNLTLEFLRLAGRLKPRWIVWENVPGVLSIDGGRTFGTFLGGMAELGYGFAYRVLDAQYFGLAQRRKRVFVVGYLGDWRPCTAVLFDSACLSGNPAPSREARQGITHAIAPSLTSSGRGVQRGGDSRRQDPVVAMCLNAKGGNGRIDAESETFIATGQGYWSESDKAAALGTQARALYESTCVTHALRGEGFDASEDGTGRGTPLVPVQGGRVCGCISGSEEDSHKVVVGEDDCTPGFKNEKATGTTPEPIAFSCKDHGADASNEVSPTLRSMSHSGSHANAGGQVAVAFHENQRGELSLNDTVGALNKGGGKPGQGYPAVAIKGEDYGDAIEADASSVLSTLRDEVGAEAVAEWGSRILDSLQSEVVLQSWLHGERLRSTSEEFRRWVDDGAPSRTKSLSSRTLCEVWQNGPDGRTSQGRGLAKQLAYELGEALPELPHQATFNEGLLHRLRATAEGVGFLRQTLSEIQKTRRPVDCVGQAPRKVMAVRRLTPREAERLQGFPPGYTQVPYRGKPAADGPRYKALGNSMAVPVMAWIGKRIDTIDFCFCEDSLL